MKEDGRKPHDENLRCGEYDVALMKKEVNEAVSSRAARMK